MIFKSILASLLGSILVVQIIAHAPLTDIFLPANLLQSFQLMISFVSFDYFPPFDYLDADFTEVWSWSPNFEWLGYDSVNFLVELGSILVFAIIQFIFVLAAITLKYGKFKCACRWLRK